MSSFGKPHIPLERPHRSRSLQAVAIAPSPQEVLTEQSEQEKKVYRQMVEAELVAEGLAQAPGGSATALAANSSSSGLSVSGDARAMASVYDADFTCVGCTGGDTRIRVGDASAFPFSAVGRFMGQLADSTSALECSGTLIGTRHVLTAAHCVFDIHGTRRKVVAMDFAPCQNGATASCGTFEASNLRLLTLFTNEPEYNPTAINYDFALITLKSNVGQKMGYLGIERGSGVDVVNLQSMGYPADKPSGTMWQVNCNGVTVDFTGNQGVFKDVTQCTDQKCANILQHNCTASEGQSGASMFAKDTYKIQAILTGKLSTNSGNSYYVGTKLDAFVFDTLNAWYSEDMSTGISPNPSSTSSSASSANGAAFPGSVGRRRRDSSAPSAVATQASNSAPTQQSSTAAGGIFGGRTSPPPPSPPAARLPGLFGIFGMFADPVTTKAQASTQFLIAGQSATDPDALFFNPLITRKTLVTPQVPPTELPV